MLEILEFLVAQGKEPRPKDAHLAWSASMDRGAQSRVMGTTGHPNMFPSLLESGGLGVWLSGVLLAYYTNKRT